MKVGGVLLASGAGTRFGGNKLLVPVDGVPLYRRAMAVLAGAGLDRLAVCSACEEVLSAGAEYGFLPLYNPARRRGCPPPSVWVWSTWRIWMGCSFRSVTSPG